MPLTNYAMIIKRAGYDPAVHRAAFDLPDFSTTVVFVSSFEQAEVVSRGLVGQGVQLIELCGAFTPEEASALHASIEGQVPVGVVRYSPQELQCLARLFGAPSQSPPA